MTGRVLARDPPRLIEHEWNVEPQKDLPHGEKSVVRWERTPDGDGTILRVTHRRVTRGTAHGFISGLHVFLDVSSSSSTEHPSWSSLQGSMSSGHCTRRRDDEAPGRASRSFRAASERSAFDLPERGGDVDSESDQVA